MMYERQSITEKNERLTQDLVPYETILFTIQRHSLGLYDTSETYPSGSEYTVGLSRLLDRIED